MEMRQKALIYVFNKITRATEAAAAWESNKQATLECLIA
jgi:hypothetical protein